MEDWYHAHDLNMDIDCWNSLEDRVVYSTDLLLDLFDKYKTKATFFVLGCVAEKHPDLVRKIAAGGHEIGSHGYWHRMVCRQTREDFRDDLLSSKLLLEDLTGKEVNLYRAPSWSISGDSLWALEILEEEGFICDSSVQPFKTPLYGISGSPVIPFHPVIGGRRLKLVEFPPTVLTVGKIRVPFAGGLYFRALPLWLIVQALKRVNKTRPGMIYVHPWETDSGQPRISVSAIIKITHYLNLKKNLDKLERILGYSNFVTLGNLIRGGVFPSFKVI